MLTILILIGGFLLALAGIVGCILPVIPGPVLSYSALIVLSWSKNWEPFSITFLVLMGALTLILSVMDNFIPAVSAKKYGASKSGIWGSVIGMLLFIFVFPPWGIFIGSFAGAVAGEFISGAKGREALQIGWGVFLGSMLGVGVKLAFSLMVLFIYIVQLF